MAHRLAERDDAERHHASRDDSTDVDATAGLDRRQYVRFAAGLVAAVTSLTGGRVAARSASEPPRHEAVRELTIHSIDDTTRYELTVDGELGPGDGASRDADARISGGSTEGIVDHAIRRYRFSGAIRDLTIDGDASVSIGRN